ncbi:hypothetical protein ACQ3I4_02110 [Zafaria sp. Z1313]|uniref:hypothetical protein n=1 Tax=unclassified Zafaria TaxID=2828765 RepID=UPI002E7691E0|nr:hypothetical protein [Zafaria sp. J156]MEE1620167.1 hypothetical protein [Zafaria sp. J156]
MTIHWDAFLIVAGTTWLSALVLVGLYSFGVRLMAVADDGGRTAVPARAGAYGCFALCLAVVLFGIYLIIPALGGS